MRPVLPLVLLVLAAPPALAQGAWSASLHGAWSTARDVPQVPAGLHGAFGVLAAGYRQLTPAFGLGVEAGYTAYAAGDVTYQAIPVCQGPSCGETDTLQTTDTRTHTLLQVSLAARLRATQGRLRPRASLSLGAYPTYVSGRSVTVRRSPAGEEVRRDALPLDGNDGGGVGAGLTLGLDVLPWQGRHALSAEVRVHQALVGYSGGSSRATFAQAGLGYTFW